MCRVCFRLFVSLSSGCALSAFVFLSAHPRRRVGVITILRRWRRALLARAMGDAFGDASLLETLRHSSTDGFFLLEGHLRRLRASAAVLGGGRRVPDPETLCQALEAEARHWPTGEASRVRLLLAPSGELRVERVALPGGLAHPEIGRLSAAAPVLVPVEVPA